MDSIRFEPKLHNPSHRKEKKGGGAHLEVAGHRLRKGSGSSTIARPLDGGALTHGRTHAPARGTAVALTFFPLAATGGRRSLASVRCERKGVGEKKERGSSRRPWIWRRAGKDRRRDAGGRRTEPTRTAALWRRLRPTNRKGQGEKRPCGGGAHRASGVAARGPAAAQSIISAGHAGHRRPLAAAERKE